MNVGTAEIIDFYNNMLPIMEQYHSKSNARIGKIKHMLQSIIRPWMSILDVGCGTGLISKFIADIGASVVAVDIAPKLIEYAIANSYHENITYKIADICNFDSDKKFDAIILSDVVEHITPSSLSGVIHGLVFDNTEDDTFFYLNIPDANFNSFMFKNYPDKLQIIDSGYTIDFIIRLFFDCNFVPAHISIYGIDSEVQYNEFVFMRNSVLNKHYKKCLNRN